MASCITTVCDCKTCPPFWLRFRAGSHAGPFYDQSDGNQIFVAGRLNVVAGLVLLDRKQAGQPVPARVRLEIQARYSWPKGHRHQTFLAAQAVIFHGVVPLFFEGSHSRAILGNFAASEFVTEKRFPAQNGHRVLAAKRASGLVCHS